MNKNLILIGFFVFFLGCFATKQSDIKPVERVPETVEIFKEAEKPKLNIEKPKPLSLTSPKWYIIIPENSEEVFSELNDDNADPVLYGLSENGYEILAKDMEKLLQHIEMLNKIIDKYKNYYEIEDTIEGAKKADGGNTPKSK